MRNKFRAIKTTVDGIVFASKSEAARYCELMQMQDEDKIYMLRCQVSYQLFGEGRKGSKYIADFSYWQNAPAIQQLMGVKDEFVVEDVKGFVNQTARLKLKMMKAVHNIDVQIIKMNPRTVDALIKGYLGARK